MLVKFGCGRIGFPPEKDKIILVRRCGSDIELSIESSKYILPENLPGTPLTQEDEKNIFETIANLISDGQKFRHLKQLLTEKEMF